jgi:hypothetical protein
MKLAPGEEILCLALAVSGRQEIYTLQTKRLVMGQVETPLLINMMVVITTVAPEEAAS